MIDLERDGELFVMTMNDGENRWNTSFVRAMAAALDEVEASTGPAALVTLSASEKFFSNGLDLDWLGAEGEHRGGDRSVFGGEFMALMGRIITLPIPTVAAVNGHAFGAGFMVALCHDSRVMRADRGFLCANEMQLGMRIPTPELALFRHKLPQHVFYESVQLARRWAGPDALQAGIVQQTASLEDLRQVAFERARQLAPLGAHRALFAEQKQRLFGENAVLDGPHGAAYLLAHADSVH
ncbi:MAG: enoyl-CoA hydratase/isomerase family protein [Pseudomonadales bacterium]|jgi:enoyl-CoA hydratase/carnithine racemase|nr:enoyl-CoA hydratase/isomerase family protein [Pseudomonadales bacterium]